MPVSMKFTYKRPKIAVEFAQNIHKSLLAQMTIAQRLEAQRMKERAEEATGYTGYKIGSDPGFPYGHAAQRPPMPQPAQFANIQSGDLHEGWRISETGISGGESFSDEITTDVYNIADESRFFGGLPTERMVARPLLQWLTSNSLTDMHIINLARWRSFWEGLRR